MAQPNQSYPVGVYQPVQQADAYPTQIYAPQPTGYPTMVAANPGYPVNTQPAMVAYSMPVAQPMQQQMMPMMVVASYSTTSNADNPELREANMAMDNYGLSQCLNVTYMVLYIIIMIVFSIVFVIFCIVAGAISSGQIDSDNGRAPSSLAYVVVFLLWSLFEVVRSGFGFYGCLKAYRTINRREDHSVYVSLRIYIAMIVWEVVTIIIQGALISVGTVGGGVFLIVWSIILIAGDYYMYYRLREFKTKIDRREAIRQQGRDMRQY